MQDKIIPVKLAGVGVYLRILQQQRGDDPGYQHVQHRCTAQVPEPPTHLPFP